MTALRALTRGNWLTIVTVVLASAIVGLLFFFAVDGMQARKDDVRRADAAAAQAIDTRQAATRRIDLLARQVGELQAERGQLATSVAALAEQVRRLGGDPIVMSPAISSTARPVATEAPRTGPSSPSTGVSSARPGTSRRPSRDPRPRSRPTASPGPSPSPQPPCLVPELPVVGCPAPRGAS